MRLLCYCPFSTGGIVDYADAQAAALAGCGVELTVLTTGRQPAATVGRFSVAGLKDECGRLDSRSRVIRQIRRSQLICDNIGVLKDRLLTSGIRHVLFASFSEYAAPLWSRQLKAMARSGIRFGAMLHDPVRNYVAGPEWWHRRSVLAGYSFLREAFVHEPVDRAEAGIPDHVQVTVVPHGPLDFPQPVESGEELRKRYGIPEHVRLLLSFGQIRDGKNLGMAIESLKEFGDVWLLVAGSEAGGTNRPVEYYQKLAEAEGVATRCRWFTEFVPADQVGSYFLAADLVLLTYSRAFRSASGVLSGAVQFRKPCLASCGQSALRTQVERYRLGVWVEPDDPVAIREGICHWLRGLPEPLWTEYLEENSWSRNAEAVRQRMFLS